MALPKNQGLLAFLYDVYTDQARADQFKADPSAFMATYNLTVEQMRVIWETGLAREPEKNLPAWTALGAGQLPPAAPTGGWEDAAWPNDAAMVLLGQMVADVLSGKPQFDNAW